VADALLKYGSNPDLMSVKEQLNSLMISCMQGQKDIVRIDDL
jgi:hypothetical protein